MASSLHHLRLTSPTEVRSTTSEDAPPDKHAHRPPIACICPVRIAWWPSTRVAARLLRARDESTRSLITFTARQTSMCAASTGMRVVLLSSRLQPQTCRCATAMHSLVSVSLLMVAAIPSPGPLPAALIYSVPGGSDVYAGTGQCCWRCECECRSTRW